MRASSLALLVLLTVTPLGAQFGGSDRVWWDSGQGSLCPWEQDFDDPLRRVSVFNTKGAVRTAGHPFFEALGTNGRACITCYQPSNYKIRFAPKESQDLVSFLGVL